VNVMVCVILGVFFYIVAWATILGNVLFVPNERKDKFTLRAWIGVHIIAIGIVFTFFIGR